MYRIWFRNKYAEGVLLAVAKKFLVVVEKVGKYRFGYIGHILVIYKIRK